jgi:hypothetical protein
MWTADRGVRLGRRGDPYRAEGQCRGDCQPRQDPDWSFHLSSLYMDGQIHGRLCRAVLGGRWETGGSACLPA